MKRILVIDDESSIAEMLQILLQEKGFEVKILHEGSGAVVLHRRHAFDLVITDLLMPGMDGISTIMLLKNEFPNLKIVALSGGGFTAIDQNPLKTAESLGACRTFMKPVSVKILLSAIQEILS